MSNRVKTVVFDFDYTLADSSLGAIESVNYALTRLGLPKASDDAIRRTIGMSLPETLRTLAGAAHSSKADEFYDLFVERADEIMIENTALFERVPSVVSMLLDMELSLGIVSSKFRYRIEEILKGANLLDAFGVIVGGEDVTNFKPHPEGLLKAVERLNSTPATSIYVGDSVVDAQTANNADLPFVPVLSGVTQIHEFDGYSKIGVLEKLTELPHFLNGA